MIADINLLSLFINISERRDTSNNINYRYNYAIIFSLYNKIGINRLLQVNKISVFSLVLLIETIKIIYLKSLLIL